jgi:hypothetical protein
VANLSEAVTSGQQSISSLNRDTGSRFSELRSWHR